MGVFRRGPWGGLLDGGDADKAAAWAAAADASWAADGEPSALAGRAAQIGAAVLSAERAAWVELITCLRLSRQVRALEGPPAGADAEVSYADVDGPTVDEVEPPVTLPPELTMLIPPEPAGGWAAGMPQPPARLRKLVVDLAHRTGGRRRCSDGTSTS